jgi:hypothetical protein
MAELKFLNVETCKVLRHGEPRISVNGKSGTVTINKEASEKMGITEASTVQAVLDDKWTYLMVNFEKGFAVRVDSEKQRGAHIVQNSSLARAILKNAGFEEKSSYRFKIGEKEDLKGLEVFRLKKQSVMD